MKFQVLKKALVVSLGLTALSSFAVKPNLTLDDLDKAKVKFSKIHYASTQISDYLLFKKHFRKLELNDELSQKILMRYIDALDYNHRIFYQFDIDALQKKYGDKLDDAFRKVSLEIAFVINNLSNYRLYQHLSYQLALTDTEPDLNTDDYLEVDRTKASFIKTEKEMKKLWENRFKNDVITQYLKGKTWKETQKILRKRYNLAIKRITQDKADDVLQLYLNALTSVFDPHTTFYSKSDAQRFEESLANELEGIGATLSMEDDVLTIKSLVKGAPAKRSNQIAVDDKIVGVGQEKGEIVDVIGWRINDIVDIIKGKKGTKVRIEIEPANGGKTKIVTLVRDKVKLEESAAKLKTKTIDGKLVSIIEIPSFYNTVSYDVEKLLKELDPKSVGLIIDLRNNGGGSLREVIRMAGFFIDQGPIVQVQSSLEKSSIFDLFSEKSKVYQDPNAGTLYDGKLIVMTNRASASASEIFAAAMKDYNRAVLVGQKTYGKGTVQSARNLIRGVKDDFLENSLGLKKPFNDNELGILSYTIQKFYRINGSSNQLKGVDVDINYPKEINEEKVGESYQKDPLPFDEIRKAEYKEWGDARKYVSTLTKKHLKRIANDLEFVVLKQEIARDLKREEENKISVNLEKRRAERKENDDFRLNNLNARFKREGKKSLKSIEDLDKEYEAPDFVLDETAHIIVDWDKLEPKED